MSVQGIEAVKRISLVGLTGPSFFLYRFLFSFCLSDISFSTHSQLCPDILLFVPCVATSFFLTNRIMQYQLLAALVPSGLLNEQALETFQYLNHTVIHHLVAIWIQS